MLQVYFAEDCKSWANWLHLIKLAYNSTTHLFTEESPYKLLYGYVPKDYLDFASWNKERAGKPQSTPNRVITFLNNIKMHWDTAHLAIAKAQVKQAELYNAGQRMIQFKPNNLVLMNLHSMEWIESCNKGVKLVQQWIGPFEIHKRINENTYCLRMSSKYSDVPIFNVEHLRPYYKAPEEEFSLCAQLPDTRLHMVEDEEVEVKAIVDHKYNKRLKGWRYCIQSKGHPLDEDEWVSTCGMKNTPALLQQYKLENSL